VAKKKYLLLAFLIFISMTSLIVAPLIGVTIDQDGKYTGLQMMSLADIMGTGGEGEAEIFWRLRMPRALAAWIAGALLSLGGMAFQALFRNPLATPYTLGISSGASLGAALVIGLGLEAWMPSLSSVGFPLITLAALLGAVLVTLIIYGFTRLPGGFKPETMLLAGVALNFFCASLILLVQYTSDITDMYRIFNWIIGSFAGIQQPDVLRMLPLGIPGTLLLFWLTRELNLLTTGVDLASSRGVNVEQVQRWIFLGVSLMIAGVVSVCGPIGFVGMMVPHMCRLMFGPEKNCRMQETGSKSNIIVGMTSR